MKSPQVSLVWDGKTLHVPEVMGKPAENQLQGSGLDNLIELAGRACYDSLGVGRSSKEYHEHIAQVGHGSVLEHANLTFTTREPVGLENLGLLALAVSGRPGVFFCTDLLGSASYPRLTLNARAIREWDRWRPPFPGIDKVNAGHIWLGDLLCSLFSRECPLSVAPFVRRLPLADNPWRVVEPAYDQEVWVSLHFEGVSRGLSHEIVRHGDFTAISQRSTRYVDESESDWCPHPLLTNDRESMFVFDGAKMQCGLAYRFLADRLQARLRDKGVDKATARKQARGAARGVLGNALETQLVFSASLSQWKWMLTLRAADPADAEIRVAFAGGVYPILRGLFPDRFQGWTTKPASDGLGDVVAPPA